MARAQSYAKRQKEATMYPDAHWKNAVLLEADQETPYHTALDERTAWFYEAVTLTAGMTSKTPGIGQVYIGIRLYQPQEAVFSGDYQLPEIVPVP